MEQQEHGPRDNSTTGQLTTEFGTGQWGWGMDFARNDSILLLVVVTALRIWVSWSRSAALPHRRCYVPPVVATGEGPWLDWLNTRRPPPDWSCLIQSRVSLPIVSLYDNSVALCQGNKKRFFHGSEVVSVAFVWPVIGFWWHVARTRWGKRWNQRCLLLD